MARKQTLKSLLGGSDSRVQVDFDVNPIALSPTINSGGRYNVAVQSTPLTNSAMQLSEALKQGVNLYGKTVGIAKQKAEDDVASMSDEDYNKFLEEGLDPEAKSLFGYTKTYNRQLAQKYYATEIPAKLSELSTDMFKDYYEYKDPAEFQAALTERTKEIYAEADEMLGGNVFGEQANNALKAATRADFINKEVAKFNSELPKRNQEMALDTISRQISGLDDSNLDQIFSLADNQFKVNAPILGKKPTADAVYTAVENRITGLINSSSTRNHDLAEEMLNEIGDGKGKNKLVGGQELFATSERQKQLALLEGKLDIRREDEYEEARKNAVPLVASMSAQLISIDSEPERKAAVNKMIEDLKDGKPFNGTVIENDYLKDLLIIQANSAKNNPKLFESTTALNYINTTSQLKSTQDAVFERGLSEQYTETVYTSGTNKKRYNSQGYDLYSEFKTEQSRLYFLLEKKVRSIDNETDKAIAFQEGEKEIGEELKVWTTNKTESKAALEEANVTAAVKAAVETIGAPEAQNIRLQFPNNEQAAIKVILDAAEQSRLEDKNSITNTSAEGTIPAGVTKKTRFNNFNKMFELKNVTPEDLLTSQSVIHKDTWEGNVFGTPIKTFSFDMVYGRPVGGESLVGEVGAMNLVAKTNAGFAQRMKVGQEAAEVMKKAGIPDSVLLSGVLPSHANAKKQSISFFFENNFISLSSAPIILDGSLENTLTAVQAWDDGGQTMDNVDDKHKRTLNQIAEKYELSMSELMNFQKTYLTKNGYLK